MKAVGLLTVVRLFFLFILSVTLPLAGHCVAYTSLLSWAGWWSSSKSTETWEERSGEISKLSFRRNNPPLLLTYDRKAVDENNEAVSELQNNQFYLILDGQPGDQFKFCFRTPPALSTGHFPSPPVFKKPLTGRGMPDIQNGGMRQVSSTPDSGRWQHEYSARWLLPAGHRSLLLTIEDNNNGWVIEPECSGIFSESAVLSSSSDSHRSANKKISLVDIFYRNKKQAEKNGSGHSDDRSRLSGPLAIPGAPVAADNSEPFTSSGGGGFGSGDDLDDLFKKRPGGGMGPLYSFEWMSELVNSVILVPGTDGQTAKKQIWDTRIVLKIKQGWNEQAIIISHELWDKIRGANLERSSGLFLALSRNPDNSEAVFDRYLNSNPAQPLQTEDYPRYAQQAFILSPKQLRSVSVFPDFVTAGIGYSKETGQAGNQMGELDNTPPANTQFQEGSGRQNQGSGGGREGGGDDGSGGSPNRGSCRICNKPAVLGFDKCRECLAREVGLIEQELTEQERELLESGTEGADSLAIRVFEWFKTLDSNERHRGDCFRNNDYYNFPALYRLLTQSFMSNKNTLSEFYLKWVKFLNGSMSLYHLISEVGELAKSQGIEDYVEVTRIVKALAHHRHEFENETSFKKFRNDLLSILMSNNLLASDDPGHVLYSGLSRQQKVMLINYIFQTFKETSWWLKDEIFPSKFLTIIMLNQFARNVNAKYGFGIPNPYIDREELFEILTWGNERPGSGECSFITPHNRRFLIGVNSQSLHALAFNITANQFLDFHDIEAILTALAVIRSMHGQRLNDLFSKNVRFAKDVPSEQLQLLRTFTLKAREQLVKFLENKGAEEKDKFIHSMFLIFGIAPKELFDELSDQPFDELSEQPSDELSDQPADELSDPEPVQLTQAVAHAAVDPQCQQTEISRSRPLALDSDTVKMLEACSKLGLDFSPWFKKKSQSVTLGSTVAQEELLNFAPKVGVDWQKFAKKTGVLNETHIRDIDAGNAEIESKARAVMEEWKKMKGQITYDDLLEVFSEIGRWDLMYDLNKRHKF